MNSQELQEILDAHKEYIDTDGESGACADFSGADLRAAYLRGAYLRYADLRGADLRDADLRGADLRGAYLEGAYLRYADLRGAYLRDADLRGADLRGAHYVLQWQAPQGGKRICYSVKHDNYVMHKLGCFCGTTDEAVTAIRGKYGSESMYEKLLVLNAEALENEE